MKSKVLIALLAAATVSFGLNARTAGDFFKDAPQEIVRLIPQSTRLDMLDYFNYGSTRASENFFGGPARITALTDARIALQVDNGVGMQIAVIPRAKADTVIAVVTTLRVPMADSSIDFYDTSWRPLKKTPMALPQYADWLTKEGFENIETISLHLPFMPVEAIVSDDGHTITLANRASEYLTAAKAAEFAPWLVEKKDFNL